MLRGKWLIAIAAAAVLGISAIGIAYESKGSSSIDAAKACPDGVTSVSVAVLMFDGPSDRASELARGSVLLNLQRHGFTLHPAAETLGEMMRRIDAAVDALPADKGAEPGAENMTRQAASAAGTELGADWVIYGLVRELRADTRESFFATRRIGVVDVQLNIIEVATGNILYWARAKDDGSCGVGIANAKGSSLERRIMTRTVGHIFDELMKALPEHETGPEVTHEQVQQFVEEMGL